MKVKKIYIKLSKSTKDRLDELSDLTGISINGIITGILWDYILAEYDKKKEKKHGKRKVSEHEKCC